MKELLPDAGSVGSCGAGADGTKLSADGAGVEPGETVVVSGRMGAAVIMEGDGAGVGLGEVVVVSESMGAGEVAVVGASVRAGVIMTEVGVVW